MIYRRRAERGDVMAWFGIVIAVVGVATVLLRHKLENANQRIFYEINLKAQRPPPPQLFRTEPYLVFGSAPVVTGVVVVVLNLA